MKQTITFRQTILKTIEFEAKDEQELIDKICDAEENPDELIDFDKEFDSLEIDRVFISEITED